MRPIRQAQGKKGFAPIFIILIAAAAILGGGVFYYAKVLKKPAQVACTQEAKQCPDGSYVGRTGPNCEFAACPISAPAQPTATSSVDVSNWKTYRNEKYGFEVGYLTNWLLEEKEWGVSFFDEKSRNPANELTVPLLISVTNTDDRSAREWFEKEYPDDARMFTPDAITVGGVIGIVSRGSAMGGCDRTVVLLKDSKIYKISIGSTICDNQGLINQILSTFKFITPTAPAGSPQANAAVSTSTWKVYKNVKYGFLFKYPADHTPYVSVDTSTSRLVPAATSSDSATIAENESDVFLGKGKLLSIQVINVDERTSTWLDENLKNYLSNPAAATRKDITIAGKPAVEITAPQPTADSPDTYRMYVIQPGNYLLVITENAPSALLDAVFSTLSFAP